MSSQRHRHRLRAVTCVAIAGIAAGWAGLNAFQVRERQAMLSVLLRPENDVIWAPRLGSSRPIRQPLPMMWKLFGAEDVGAINLPPSKFTDEDARHIQSLFPEAEVYLGRPLQ
jgi:hypothetical protein